MFEAIELGQKMSKADFKAHEPEMRAQLMKLQLEMMEQKIAMLIIVSGIDGAGKGEVVDRLSKWLDTRGIETHAFWDRTDEEQERPGAWSYWKRLPAKGSIGVMFGGWYRQTVRAHAGGDIDTPALNELMSQARELEHMLHVDGMLIVKLWYHLSDDARRKRNKAQKKLGKRARNTRRKQNHKQYKAFVASAERALRDTDTGECPWHIIEADDKHFRDMTTGKVLATAMAARLKGQRVSDRRALVHDPVGSFDSSTITVLDTLDLTASLDRKEYDELLDYYQQRLLELSWQMYNARRSTVMVFEGADAAGKGGSIRRLTTAMDTRLYRVISVAAPSDEELAHHYLWRFWRQFPRAGYMSIYDRSWYGRVLVERVEGFAQQHEWMRAYGEINSFEQQITDHGIALLKFWLHISPETQLERFQQREQTPWKQHKITDEDWRNREKWGEYKQAVNDMVIHTSTPNAPWTLVSAEDKLHARVEVLKTVCERLEESL